MSARSSANVVLPAPSTPSMATLATSGSRAIRRARTPKSSCRSAHDLHSTIETIAHRGSTKPFQLVHLLGFCGAVETVKVCAGLAAASEILR